MNFASTLNPPLQEWCNWMISKLSKKLQGLGPTKALTWKYSKTRECNWDQFVDGMILSNELVTGHKGMQQWWIKSRYLAHDTHSWIKCVHPNGWPDWQLRYVALQYQKILKILCKIQPALTTWKIVMLVNISRYVQHQSILHDPMGQKQKPLQWYHQLVSNHVNWYQLSQL